jgi:four helix bundle protein
MSKENEFDLEERLIDFAVRIIKLTEALPTTRSANHIGSQLLRSGTSPASNYAEAQSAESRSDFVHKIKVALKELRETKVWLRMTGKAGLVTPPSKLDPLLHENDELIAIFVASVKTATKNRTAAAKSN